MSEKKSPFTNDQDFDTLLIRSVPKVPPDDIVAQTIPGKKALNRILIGYFLYTFIMHFLGLDLLLPLIGQILVLLGFRSLRHENRWFRVCYTLENFHALALFSKLILNATIFEFPPDTETTTIISYIVQTVFTTVSLFCFWRGLRSVQKARKIHSKATSVLALLALNLMISVMGFLQFTGKYSFNSWYTLILLVVSFLFILWMISRLGKTLDETGYVLQPTPRQISDYAFALILTAIPLIGCICGYLFYSSYDMDWHATNTIQSPATQEIKDHLEHLGFPEYILNDLSSEDLALCEGAKQVIADSAMRNSTHPTFDNKDYDITLTNIAVLIPGEEPRIVIFHHFCWFDSPTFAGTAALSILPAYEASPEDWLLADEMTGRILYNNDGEQLSATYHSINTHTATSHIFTNIPLHDQVNATFSFPNQGKHHRGYVVYSVTPRNSDQMCYSQMTYIHQKQHLQYPVTTAESHNAFSTDNAFVYMQPSPLIFDLTTDGIQLR